MMLEAFVPGVPVSKGSLKGFNHFQTRKLILTESNKGSKEWQLIVAFTVLAECNKQRWDLQCGPLVVWLNFYLPKPKSFPKKVLYFWHLKKPDIDKLTRSVLDACTVAKVWDDDCRVSVLHVTKEYADVRTHPEVGVRIRVHPINDDGKLK